MSERSVSTEPKLFQITCPKGADSSAVNILRDIGIIVEPTRVNITRVVGTNGNQHTLEQTGVFATCYKHQEEMIRTVIERRAGWVPEVSEIKDEYFDG